MSELKRLGLAVFVASIVTLASFAYYFQDDLWSGDSGSNLDEASTLSEPFGPVFPRLNRSQTLYVVNVTDLTQEEKMAMVSLQGIVNRNSAELYLEYGNTKWLNFLNQNYGQAYEFLSMDEALTRFGNRASGLVIYDPKRPGTVNIATNYAALDNLLITAPELEGRLSGVAGLGVSLNLSEGEWGELADGAPLYEKAFEEFYPHMKQDAFGLLLPKEPYLRDYLIALNMLCLDLNPGPVISLEENLLMDAVIAETPVGTTVLGWFDAPTGVEENLGVQRLSKGGKVLVPTDHMPNLSVFGAYDFETKPEYKKLTPPANLALEDKVYLTFMISDGDNIALMHREYTDMWDYPVRGTIPLGWSVSPVLSELAPPLLEYYSSTTTDNDTLVAAPSGAGYFYPGYYPEGGLGPLLARTDALMNESGLDIVWTLNSFKAHEIEYPDYVLESYADYTTPRGVFLDYSDVPLTKEYWIGGGNNHTGIPYIRATHLWVDTENFLAKINVTRDAHPKGPYFIFVATHVWSMGPNEIMDVIQALNATLPDSDFAVVSPHEFFSLIQLSEVERAEKGLLSLDEFPYGLLQGDRDLIQGKVTLARRALDAGRPDEAALHASEANLLITAIKTDALTLVTVIYTAAVILALLLILGVLLRARNGPESKGASEWKGYLPQIVLLYLFSCVVFLAFFRALHSDFWDWPSLVISIGVASMYRPLLKWEKFKHLASEKRLFLGALLATMFGMATLFSAYFLPVVFFGFIMFLDAMPLVREKGPVALFIPMTLAMLSAGLARQYWAASLIFGVWALCVSTALTVGKQPQASRQDAFSGKESKAGLDKPPSIPMLFLALALMAFYIPSSRYLSLKTGHLQAYLWNLFIIIPLGAMAAAFIISGILNSAARRRNGDDAVPSPALRGGITGVAALFFGIIYFAFDPLLLSMLILFGQVCIITIALISLPKRWNPDHTPKMARSFVVYFTVLNMVFILPVVAYTLYITKLGYVLNYLLYSFPLLFAIALAIMIIPMARYNTQD